MIVYSWKIRYGAKDTAPQEIPQKVLVPQLVLILQNEFLFAIPSS
jgi:hypothetical protein